MVSIIIAAIVFVFLMVIAAIGYVLCEHWIDQTEKTEQKPKAPIRKMEYDCTENFYHD